MHCYHGNTPVSFLCILRYMSYCKHCYGNNNVFNLVQLVNFMSLSTIYTYLNLHLSCLIFVAHFNQFWFSWQILIKVCNIKYKQNMSSCIQVDTCGQTDGETRQTWHSKHALSQLCECVEKKGNWEKYYL